MNGPTSPRNEVILALGLLIALSVTMLPKFNKQSYRYYGMKVFYNFLQYLSFHALISALLVPTAGWCLAAISFSPSEFFKEGVQYSYRAGTRGFSGGIVLVEQKNNVLNFKVKLRVLGAGTFSRTNVKEVLSISHPQISPADDFFLPGLNSFNDNEILKEKIHQLIRNVESKFQTEYTRLHLDVELGNDSDYLNSDEAKIGDYREYLMKLRSAVNRLHQQKNTDAIPISVVALPEADRASPSEWDIYSDPRVFAHEFFHIIGSMFEGYERVDYPPNGIMQDGYMFDALDKFGTGHTAGVLLPSDVLELISNSFGSAKNFTPSPENLEKLNLLIQNYASGRIQDGDNPRRDYLAWPPQTKAEAARKSVQEWILSFDRSHASKCASLFIGN